MSQNDLGQIYAATIVAVRRGCSHTPKRRRHELRASRAIVIPLVEVWAEIVPLEVREDVTDEKRLQTRPLQTREAASIVNRGEQRAGGSEQVVKDTLRGVIYRLDIRDSSIKVYLKIRNMTLRTPDAFERSTPLSG